MYPTMEASKAVVPLSRGYLRREQPEHIFQRKSLFDLGLQTYQSTETSTHNIAAKIVARYLY